MVEVSHKTLKKQALFTSFWDFIVILLILLFTFFDAANSFLGENLT